MEFREVDFQGGDAAPAELGGRVNEDSRKLEFEKSKTPQSSWLWEKQMDVFKYKRGLMVHGKSKDPESC